MIRANEPHPCGLDEEAAAFILTNAGTLAASEMARLLGVTKRAMKKAIQRLGVNTEIVHRLPKGLAINYLPVGTVRHQSARGKITRVPCSSPGIVSCTFFSHWDEPDEEDTTDDEHGDSESSR